MHDGIILHHFFLDFLPPLLIQQLSRSAVCSGIVHSVCVSPKNRFHNCVVTLQWRNRWLLVSSVSLQREHQEAIYKTLLFNFSWVEHHALLVTNEEKHYTFVGTLFLLICFQGPSLPPGCSFTSSIYSLLTETLSSLECFHLIESVCRHIITQPLSQSPSHLSAF